MKKSKKTLGFDCNVDPARPTLTLPDGYNGPHGILCYSDPVEVDGNLVKLQVAGSTYLFTWASPRADAEGEIENAFLTC